MVPGELTIADRVAEQELGAPYGQRLQLDLDVEDLSEDVVGVDVKTDASEHRTLGRATGAGRVQRGPEPRVGRCKQDWTVSRDRREQRAIVARIRPPDELRVDSQEARLGSVETIED